MFEIRTFRVNSNSIVAGRSIDDVERMIEGARIYVDRVRRDGKIEKPGLGFVLRAGDVICMAGRHEILIDHANKFGIEVPDRDLAQGAIDAVDVMVTQKKIDGMSLVELGHKPFARSVFLRGLSRSGIAMPVMPATIVQRGDVLSIVGAPEATKVAIDAIGVADRVTDITDMALVGLGIVVGALVGIPAIRFGALEIGLKWKASACCCSQRSSTSWSSLAIGPRVGGLCVVVGHFECRTLLGSSRRWSALVVRIGICCSQRSGNGRAR